MRIFIITMDEPLFTNDFIKEIIRKRRNQIVGVATNRTNRLTLSKGKSKYAYLISMMLIMGLGPFLRNALISMNFKLKKRLAHWKLCKDPSLLAWAREEGIKTYAIRSPNEKSFLQELAALKPDVIINQCQNILKKDLLSIPTIGVLNRHNALLPRNRGRLTPFWVLYKEEMETGVSIHFVEDTLDSGDIIVQKKFKIASNETFNSLVKKNYEIAPAAMEEALQKLERGESNFIRNAEEKASYNYAPDLKDAWQFRKKRCQQYFRKIVTQKMKIVENT